VVAVAVEVAWQEESRASEQEIFDQINRVIAKEDPKIKDHSAHSGPLNTTVCINPPTAATFINVWLGLSQPENPLRAIWSNLLRMLLFISSLVHLSIVPHTYNSLGQSPSQQMMRLRPTRL